MKPSPLEAQLLAIRDAFHSGSWAVMLADLRACLDARPYNHAVHQRVAQDIEKVEELARAEAKSGARRHG